MSVPSPYPPKSALAARLRVDRRTGVLYWKNGPRAGQVAGHPKGNGYLMVRFDGRSLLAHRVVFILVNGFDPFPLYVDHIDGDKSNNAPRNLRALTNADNVAHRTRLNRNNSSGHTGVHWSSAAGKWAAVVKRDYRTRHLGLFDSIEDAARARREAIEKNQWMTPT